MSLRFLLLVAACSACGGKVMVDLPSKGAGAEGAEGGPAGSSTSAGTGGSSSISSASAGGAVTTSVTSGTVGTGGSGGTPDCSQFGFNGIGAGCGQEGTICLVPHACCAAKAICKAGTWVADAPPCNEPCVFCHDTFGCEVGSLCVVDQAFEVSYQCFPNPCFEDIDCACAEPLCAQNFMSCGGVQGTTVFCGCADC